VQERKRILFYGVAAVVDSLGGLSPAKSLTGHYDVEFHKLQPRGYVQRMPKQADFVLLWILVLASSTLVHGQESYPAPANGPANQKTLIVATETKSDSVVAVPPITSVSVNLRADKKLSADAIDLSSWIAKEAALNGLQSADVLPWHVVVAYDQFDEDGDNVHSGAYEEYWAGEKKYKRIYKSDNLNQTDYGTD